LFHGICIKEVSLTAENDFILNQMQVLLTAKIGANYEQKEKQK